MKRLLLIAALTVPVQNSMASGIPVADIVAAAQRAGEILVNVQRWQSQLRDMAATVSTLNATYDSFTGITNLLDVARDPLLNSMFPEDIMSMYNDAVDLGLGDLFSGALNLAQATQIRDVCADIVSDQVRSNCNAQQASAYKLQYTSEQVYENTTLRSTQIEKLTAKLSTTSDPKEVMDLQAAIQTEQAAIANARFQLDAMQVAHDASEATLQQQQAQMAAQTWDIKKGVQMTPITFGD